MVPNTEIKLGPFTLNPRISVYAIVMLLVMYAVWVDPNATFELKSYVQLVAATFLMLLAVGLSHLLSEALDEQIRLGKKISWNEYRRLIKMNSQYLLTTIPVAIVLLLPLIMHWSGESGANELILLSWIAMYSWGVFAGSRIGYGKLGSLIHGLAYLGVGFLVVLLKLVASH